ncbi:MAG: ParB N-terminal domain-containing protein [Anaerolineales bacterium]|jgi:hypothetical protein
MKPLPELPELKIIDTASLQPHEDIDPARIDPLIQALGDEGLLRNPPIVLPLNKEPERYLVLDGANRTMAFKEMGIPHVLVQVVHFGSESLRLRTWNRVIFGAGPDELFKAMAEKVETIPLPRERRARLEAISTGSRLAYLSLPDGSAWGLGRERERLEPRVEQLQRLLATVEDIGQTERSGEVEAEALAEVYEKLSGLLIFPEFEIEEVIEVANAGICLPSGLTRFIISPRALRLNYPLERLTSGMDRDRKQQELDDWVHERVKGRKVRFYAESTFLFDE